MTSCWQHLVNLSRERRDTHPFESDGWSEERLRRIDYQLAKSFIEEYEWLGNIGATSLAFGLYLDSQLASVVCFGPHVSPRAGQRLLGDVEGGSLLQLCRGATRYWAPKWAPSRLLGYGLRQLSQRDCAAVLAYADPQAGEIGTIYQACNAIYLGTTDPGGAKRYRINGELLHPRTVYRRYGSRASRHLESIDPDYETIPIHPKHRYLFLTGTEEVNETIRASIAHLIDDYPKRDAGSRAA